MNNTVDMLTTDGIARLVTKREYGDGLPRVIILEKANSNISCEKNIIRILRRLHSLNHHTLICLEGASGKLQPELFMIFPKHRRFNRAVTAKLVLEGYLTGVEYWLVNDEPAVQANGVEDLNLYRRMREDHLVLLTEGQEWKIRLSKLLDALLDSERFGVSPALVAFFKTTPFAEVDAVLPQIPLQEQIESLYVHATRYRIDLSGMPTLASGLSTVILSVLSGQQPDIDGIMVEMNSLRSAVIECLAKGERNQEYVSLRRQLVLTAKIVSGECSVEDATMAAIHGCDALELVESLSRFFPRTEITTITHEVIGLQNVLRHGMDFYALLQARSDQIALNTVELMQENAEDTAVLLIGGALRHGVENGLGGHGVSYYVIQPAMTVSEGDDLRYRNQILGKHDAVTQYPGGQASADCNAFVAEMDDDLFQLLQATDYGFTSKHLLCFEGLQYPLSAFAFVLRGITEATRQWDRQVRTSSVHDTKVPAAHFSGQYLCDVLVDLAIAYYESDAYATLDGWGIRETVDFGKIVFALSEACLVSKTDEDNLTDFTSAVDLRTLIAARKNTEALDHSAQLDTQLDSAMRRFGFKEPEKSGNTQ